MDIYLYQNGVKTGPFNEDQILQMLQAAIVSPDTLGWKEGLTDWERLSAFFPNIGVPITSNRSNSPLGIISFILTMVSMVAWFVLFTIAGVVHHSEIPSRIFNIITGAFALGLILFNLLALIFGVVVFFKDKANALVIVGACLNGLILIGIMVLLCLGVAANPGH